MFSVLNELSVTNDVATFSIPSSVAACSISRISFMLDSTIGVSIRSDTIYTSRDGRKTSLT